MSRFAKRANGEPVTVEWLRARCVEDPERGCWLWQASCMSNGYGACWHNGSVQNAAVVMLELVSRPVPEGQEARHSCHVRRCINPAHLSAGTSLDNKRDMMQANRHGHGVVGGCDHPSSKLTANQVRQIRRSANSMPILARHFGVSLFTIWKIKHRLSYTAVTDQ